MKVIKSVIFFYIVFSIPLALAQLSISSFVGIFNNYFRVGNQNCIGDSGNVGICMTNFNCREALGTPNGICGTGLGVCCLFMVSNCGKTIQYNNTYIVNPEYPSGHKSEGECSYKITKQFSDICSIKLTFERFSIKGPNLKEKNQFGDCLLDKFSVSRSLDQDPHIICGENQGMHMFIDLPPTEKENELVLLGFSLQSEDFSRVWKILVNQIECTSSNGPPSDCLMYFIGSAGKITSFNYKAKNPDQFFHLNKQIYQVCVRQEHGYCGIRWTTCKEMNSFQLSGKEISLNGEKVCNKDYLYIPGTYKDRNNNQRMNSHGERYCGHYLNRLSGNKIDEPIYSYTQPFGFYVHLDNEENYTLNFEKGFCLNYVQIPC